MGGKSYSDLLSVIRFVIVLLKLTGFWKSEDNLSIYNGLLYKAYRLLSIFIIITHLYFEILYFFKYWSYVTISQLASVLFTLASGLTNSAMIFSLFLRMDTIHSMVAQMKSEVFQPKHRQHRNVIEKALVQANLIKNYFLGNMTLILVSLPSLALYRGEKIALLAYVPSWFGEIYFFILQVIGIGYNVYTCATYVVFNCTMLIQIGAQIDILKINMEHIDGMETLMHCVHHYSEIITFKEKLEKICSYGMLFSFLCDILCICTTLFNIAEATAVEVLILLFYTGGVISIIFVHCFFGNAIIFKSEDLSYALFKSNWMDQDVRYQKSLLLFIMFTKESVRINLGKILTLYIPVFLTIIKTAYSYFTILENINAAQL